MDIQQAKTALMRELASRIAVSGGPEVFRRLVPGPAEVTDAALAELAAEGWLKRTQLRVGTVYHFPPNVKPSLERLERELAAAPRAEVTAGSAGPARCPYDET